MADDTDPLNPFDALGLDPTLDAQALTEVLRRRAERLAPEARQQLQAAWRKLTLNDRERIRLALLAHPRDEATPADPVAALREQVPPRLDRREPPPMTASCRDALVTEPPRHTPPRPAAGFAAIAREGLDASAPDD